MYAAEITRNNPGCFIFLIDQSGSMSGPMAGTGDTKDRYVADTINRTLQEIAFRCAKEDGIRDYFHVTVIGYGEDVQAAWGGKLSDRDCVPIGEVAQNHLDLEERRKKIPDGAGGLVEVTTKFPIWISPVSAGGTPMCKALELAADIARKWVKQYPKSFPPICLNLSDGESTDGNPEEQADRLRGVQSKDGNVLLFNLHVSSDTSPSFQYPHEEKALPNSHARTLFRMSSVLTPGMMAYANHMGVKIADGMRGFVFNADATSIVQFIDIGTRATRQV